MSVEEDVARRLAQLRHDLRTPLTVVVGFTDLLSRDDLSAEQRRHYASRVASAAAEMRDMIDALAPDGDGAPAA